MQFVFQSLTWGFLLALLPLLIHLINLMRQKRVKWAAMEFLLASQRKHRQWVWLKQLLLLLMRMLAVALAVAMVAQLKTKAQWLDLLGAKPTHYYVLLDDSFSMSQRAGGASALDGGRQVLRGLVNRAQQADSPQKITLLRYSKARGGAAASGEEGGSLATVAADFLAEPITASFDLELEKKQEQIAATALAVGPAESLGVLKRLIRQAPDENREVLILSDFREKDWTNPTEIKALLDEISKEVDKIELVDCARGTDANLAVLEIAASDETRAAGVPLFVNVKVKNFGTSTASKVQLKLRSYFFPPAAAGSNLDPESVQPTGEDLATLLIDQIGAGETLSRQVQVYFPQPGKHVVEARLPEDAIEADNRRQCVIEFPEFERVLVVDGSEDSKHSYYLEAAFRPLERSNTGIVADVRPLARMRDISPEQLRVYSSVYLLEVPQLDPQFVRNLEEYVSSGGGLAFFAGDATNVDFYNRVLFKEGAGLYPIPIAGTAELPADVDDGTPDFEFTRHPIFSFFVGQNNPLIRGVKVTTYRQAKAGYTLPEGAAVEVIARLRDRSPLVIEKKLGKGTVVAFQTTLAPEWNDLAKNPSIVVILLRLQSYLASASRLDDPRTVGEPLAIPLNQADYRGDVSFIIPGEKETTRLRVDRRAGAVEGEAGTILARLGTSAMPETDVPGIYEAWPVTTKGELRPRRFAFNVVPEEGNLQRMAVSELVAKLEPVKVEYSVFDKIEQGSSETGGQSLSHWLMLGLLGLLMLEMWMGLLTSYLPKGGSQ